MSGLTSFPRDGLVFAVTDSGPADGDPVLLLHGFPERATSWEAVSERLNAGGLRTLAPDQRGYSPGARPRFRWSYRLPTLVADVVELCQRIGRPVHLVGHDWGAVVAWALAAHHPELVRTLTAVSVPHPGAFLEAVRRGPQLRDSWYFLPFNVPFLVEGLARYRPHVLEDLLRRGGMTDEDLARVREEIVSDGALRGGLSWYRAVMLSSPGYAGRRVAVPTTYVWSTGDVALSRVGAEACERYVDAPYELVVLDDVSHWIPTLAPGPLADAILARIASVG
ncbi:alpha/beta fold hydrolase [Nocardioides sp. GCM10027113]|uniref:alpha/beta fold hydrolase n=1 Tax=unclassified Nocardioides TaxID=2615069 RepID=UPI00360F8339